MAAMVEADDIWCLDPGVRMGVLWMEEGDVMCRNALMHPFDLVAINDGAG